MSINNSRLVAVGAADPIPELLTRPNAIPHENFLASIPEVGQIMLMVTSSRNRGPSLSHVKVSKVGRKYFYLDEPIHMRRKFLIETKREIDSFNSDLSLFANEPSYRLFVYKKSLASAIKHEVSSYLGDGLLSYLSLQDLRVIARKLLKAERKKLGYIEPTWSQDDE